MKKLSILSMIIAAFLLASCDRTLPGGETPVGDATLSIRVAGTQATRALVGTNAAIDGASNVLIEDLTVFVFNATDHKLAAMGSATSAAEVIDIPVNSGITYNIYVIGNKKSLDFSSYVIGTTLESDLIFTNTTDLSTQEAISSSKLTPTVTGYYFGATMTYGKNYLGYDDDDITSGNNFIDGAFYVHRLISRVFLSGVTNNNDNLKITAVSILNAKSKSKLFPATPAGNNTSATPADLYYKIAFPEVAPATGFTPIGSDGYIWNYSSFAQGTLANTAGGTRFPRLYKDVAAGPAEGDLISAAVAPASLKDISGVSTSSFLRYELPTPTAGNDISSGNSNQIAFYLFANDSIPGDQATILLIEGLIGTETTPVYYPIVINKEGHGTIDAGSTGEENTFIKRNRQYTITATIGADSRGIPNPWLNETASLDVQVTVSDWVATITQDVTF